MRPSTGPPRSRRIYLLGVPALVFLAAIAGTIAWFNPRLTRYVESEKFREALDRATAKGLHFEAGHYAPIRRTGFLTAASDAFQAENGKKTLKSIDAHGLTAKFNPWGVFLRRWQLDDVHIQSREVGIQTYEPKPEPSPAKPWFAIFLPDRVYLKRVRTEPLDVTWRFREEKGGFFNTRLLITPHGRDFEYRATDGTMKMALMPDLKLRRTHLLVTKTLFTLYDLDLTTENEMGGTIHVRGTAGLRDDRSVKADADFGAVPISVWLPASWQDNVRGVFSGKAHYESKNAKIETSSGEGTLRLEGGHVSRLPFLEKLALITNEKSIETLDLTTCSLDAHWKDAKIEIKNIAVEDDGKFRVEGSVQVDHENLQGSIRLGAARKYLAWLPKAEEIFSEARGGYLWTTVRLSGTLQEPRQDLSPRIAELLKENPGAALEIFFRGIGGWFKRAFGQ